MANFTRILLVRHGATMLSADDRFAGSTDVELSDAGREQVKRLAARLRGMPIAAAYCSDLRRARDTATVVAAEHGLTPIPLAALREIDHGRWEGVRHKEVETRDAAEYQAWSADPVNYAPPGGESGASVLARLRSLPALKRIVADHPGQTVLVVSHKATNRLLIAKLMGMKVRRYRDLLAQELACLNILHFRTPDDAQLILMNDASHCASAPV